MPTTLTLGHILGLATAICLLVAVLEAVRWARYRDHGRGTPGYARARTARRAFLYALAIALALAAIACFTPVGRISMAGGGS